MQLEEMVSKLLAAAGHKTIGAAPFWWKPIACGGRAGQIDRAKMREVGRIEFAETARGSGLPAIHVFDPENRHFVDFHIDMPRAQGLGITDYIEYMADLARHINLILKRG